MKLKLFLALVFFAQATAQAGDKTGNGGTVLVCGDKVGLADLEEVGIRVGLKGKLNIPESEASVERQVQEAFWKITDVYPFLSQPIQDEWKSIKSRIIELDGEYSWTVTDDIGSYPLPKNCELQNTVMYIENGPIEVQKSLLHKLTKTHQAALWVHEVIYKLTRDRTAQTTTLPTRRLVAMLFADNANTEILYSLVNRYVAPENPKEQFNFVWNKWFDAETIKLLYLKATPNLKDVSAMCAVLTADSPYGSAASLSGFKPGDYLFAKMKLNLFGNTTATISGEVALMRNDDWKPHRKRRRFQNTALNLGRFEFTYSPKTKNAAYFVGILSPKMEQYMNGLL